MQKVIKSSSEHETIESGRNLAQYLKPGMKVFLEGDLGAGKTCLVKGLAHGLGISEIVKSPTYTLLREYKNGDATLYHFDFYRIENASGVDVEHIEHILEEANSYFVFEWPERLEHFLGEADITIKLTQISPTEREIVVSSDLHFGR